MIDHDLTFSNIHFPIKFIETRVILKQFYDVPPQIRVWFESISPDITKDQFPYFSVPSYLIKNNSFTLFHTEYDSDKFKVYYKVYEVKLEEKERGSV